MQHLFQMGRTMEDHIDQAVEAAVAKMVQHLGGATSATVPSDRPRTVLQGEESPIAGNLDGRLKKVRAAPVPAGRCCYLVLCGRLAVERTCDAHFICVDMS